LHDSLFEEGNRLQDDQAKVVLTYYVILLIIFSQIYEKYNKKQTGDYLLQIDLKWQ
jgi:hypothetical protein